MKRQASAGANVYNGTFTVPVLPEATDLGIKKGQKYRILNGAFALIKGSTRKVMGGCGPENARHPLLLRVAMPS